MAQFRGFVQGSRGAVTRLGGKESGLQVHADGWGAGVRVSAWHDPVTDKDVFRVFVTGGSGHGGYDRMIAVVTDDGKGPGGGPSATPVL